MVIRPFRREALVAPGEEKGMRLDNCSVEGFAVTHLGTAGKAPPRWLPMSQRARPGGISAQNP
jgi:hypothetical protein